MTSITSTFGISTDDPKLIAFHKTRDNPQKARCIKDSPSGTYIDYHEFKKGDIVVVDGLVGRSDGGFDVSIPAVCGFYDATAFELLEKTDE